MRHRERIEWQDIWVTGANDDKLPRLLIVGDSIARSYFAQVETELKDAFLCARMTTSTCVCDQTFEKQMALLLDDYPFAVIHFNNGLHGVAYDDAAYGKALARVLDFIKERSPQSRLIWASSTPLRRKGNMSELDPKTDQVRERNRLAREIALKRNLTLNDLFGCVVDHPEYSAEDAVHFNADGQTVLGKQVARIVRAKSG